MDEPGQKRPRAKLELLGETSVDTTKTAEAAGASNRRIRPRNSSGSPAPAQQRLGSLTPAECSDRRIRPGSPAQKRNIRPYSNSGSPAQQRLRRAPLIPMEITVAYYYFLVYLPNATSVKVRVDGAILFNLTVKKFVELTRLSYEQSTTSNSEASRPIQWSSKVHLDDFKGLSVEDGDFSALVREIKEEDRCLLLFDGHPDTVHYHEDLWNVTPEPHLLETLPQDYTLFSALADELDNSLQAVYQLEFGKKRLICVELDLLNNKIVISDTGKGMDGTVENSISKWGTLGASLNRHGRAEAIGGRPPYLKPNFGMYGFGGIGAGFHLGGSISVLSKTETSERVAILHLPKNTLHSTTAGGKVWKTSGEFRPPTPEEIALSPHGSFTKVEISDLKGEIPRWRVAGIQRKLKDYYFPYIQNDEGTGGTTFTPVEIQVNGVNLAEVVGGEVAHTNYFSGNGKPYVLTLKFTRNRPDSGTGNADMPDKANARITCHYFPIKQGREAIDDIIEKLSEEDPEFLEVNFEKFPRRSIRRLGRLLPDSQSEKLLPFMVPKRNLKPNALNKHVFKRVKAFIDVDAGFTPNQTKMDLSARDLFSEALLNLGSRGSDKWTYSESGPVTLSIRRMDPKTGVNEDIQLKDLQKDYEQWITSQHCTHDTGPIFEESDVIFCSTTRHKRELKLNMSDDVFQVSYGIKCRAGKTDIEWTVGHGKAPVRLKLLKGIPGLNNDSVIYVTVECFVSAGFGDAPGEARIICRPMEVPEDRGSKEIRDESREPDFLLGESWAFPIEDILFSNKYEVVKEEMWQKRMEKVQGRLPGFVELLNDQETLKLVGHKSIPKLLNQTAGVALPTEIFAVVRPNLCKQLETLEYTQLDQKFIISEELEMKLVVRRMKYHPAEVNLLKKDIEKAEVALDSKISASTCKIDNQRVLKGLYKFSTATFESITKSAATYFLSFSLVSAKHQDVDEYIVRMNVSPSLKIGKWTICSHSGECEKYHNVNHRDPPAVKLRLGRERPSILYLSRFDQFGNPMEFVQIPSDIACSISTSQGDEGMLSTTVLKDSIKITDDKENLEIPITLDEGNLAPFKPTMQAALKMSIAGTLTESFRISVSPGGVSSARVKESSVPPESNLHPDQIIDQIVFEVLDKCQNPVSSGQMVKVALDGFRLQDKAGFERKVDENGCLDLGMRLRVTAGYGEAARVALWSTEEQTLLMEKTFKTVRRSLRVKNVPDSVRAGSDLMGVAIEVVDENGEVDQGMDGQDHTLTVDWNRNIFIPLLRGQCTLQPIRMPRTEERWKGCVSHTKVLNLRTDIQVNVKKDVESDRMGAANDNSEVPSNFSLVPVDTGSVSELDYMKALCQSSLDGAMRLENNVKSLTGKLSKHKKKLEELRTMQVNYETSKQQYRESVELNRLQFDIGCTKEQVEVQIANLPRTNAANLMLQAKREHSEPVLDDVIGVVALLGAVETKELNRALVEFLGLENMLAIVCRSKIAAEYMGMPSIDKVLDKNNSLFDFAKSRNLEISGRFRVITLTDESRFYNRVDGQPAVDKTHPQKLLNMEPIDIRPKGSLGYAVNLVHLNQEQLATRVSGHHGLRESLFFRLFGFLEVFDTIDNMMYAVRAHKIRDSALSLDGGLIRTHNMVELGLREDPVVWFPTWIPPTPDHSTSPLAADQGSHLEVAPQPLQSITPPPTPTGVRHLQRRGLHDEIERSWRDVEQKYLKDNVPTQIKKMVEKIRRNEEKLNETLQELGNYNNEHNYLQPRREQIADFNRKMKQKAAMLGSQVEFKQPPQF